MKNTSIGGRACAAGLGVALLLILAHVSFATAQDGNLLVNGSMEGEYNAQDGIPQLQMPNGWRAWFIEGGGAEWANLRPEFSTSSASAGYAERVHSGDRAMRYFKGWATFTAGAYQSVTVTPGVNVEFSAWGHSWSCLRWNDCQEPRDALGLPPRVWSTNDAGKVHMKIGIDPTGGTDPFSGNVVWSPEAPALDNYVQFTVRATAQGDRVTVFLYASQDYPAENQDAYWDDAVLTAGGAGAAPSSGGSSGSVSLGVAVIPTYPPREDGRIIHTVRAGETLGGIAVAYGLPGAQAVRDLNNLTGDIINVGQELLVGTVEAAAPAEGESAAEPEAGGGGGAGAAVTGGESAATPDATSVAATEVAAAASLTTGEICVRVFGDDNQNRVFDGGERMLGGSTVTVKRGSETLANYRTDGVSEPHCFTRLEPGDYRVETTPPRAYGVTTSAALAVRVEAGRAQAIDVGVARGVPTSESIASAEVAAGQETAPTPAPLAGPTTGNRLTDLLSKYAGLVVLGLAGVVAVAWAIWTRVRR